MSQMKDFRERMKAKATLTPAKLEAAESSEGLPPVDKEPPQPMAQSAKPTKSAAPKKAKKVWVPPVIVRLPPGSRKILDWDGIKWSGTLTVPGVDTVFCCIADTEKSCFRGLHAAYEKYMLPQKAVDAAE